MTGITNVATLADVAGTVGRHAVAPEAGLMVLLAGALALSSAARLRGRTLGPRWAMLLKAGVGLGLCLFVVVVGLRFHAYA